MRLKKMTNPDNEGTLTFRIKLQLIHFQWSARSAKKSNDFFGIIIDRSFKIEFVRSTEKTREAIFLQPNGTFKAKRK
jgi:hypothetical protein